MIRAAFVFTVSVAIGCGTAPAPAPTPIPATPPPPPVASASAPAVSAEPVASTPPAPVEDPCRGASFDLDALPAKCTATKGAETTIGAFTVKLVPSSMKVRGGDDLAVSVEITNTTADEATFVFTPSCAKFEPAAYRNNKRADFINNNCGFGGGCGGAKRRFVVTPGGKLIKKLVLSTVVRVLNAKCDEQTKGPLAAGRYELRVSTSPFFPLAEAAEGARAQFDVTK